jgi:flagellar motor switch protein FliN/FliY
MDVDMKLTVELGRARLKFRDVLNLTSGSVVELAKLTSEPVDIMVNGALLATGEVVVVDDHFSVRVTKLLNRVERLKRVL